jgi:CBS domain-containing protein
MPIVNQILNAKGNQVWSVEPETPVFDALKLMAEKDVGALLVRKQNKVVGIISERDYARKVILKGKFSKDIPVSEIMISEVFCVNPNQTFEECMALMTAKHIRHLPVLQDDELIGIISIGDVVNAIISEKQFVISQLENYIKGY